MPPTIDTWHGCYNSGWNGLIVPEAYSHPAKFSRALIQKIYQHCLEEHWLRPGDTCADPFGGVALGGLDAALSGIHWIGIELESRFCALAHGFDCGGSAAKHEACSQQGAHEAHHVTGNLELWNRRYSHLPQWVAPTLLQGDSRNLAAVLREQVECCVSSPPYNQSLHNKFDVQDRETREQKAGKRLGGGQITHDRDYGSSPENLGNLPPGSLDACLSSPPFQDPRAVAGRDASFSNTARPGRAVPLFNEYGTSPAQLGNLPAGTVEAVVDGVVASPPWEDQLVNHGTPADYEALRAKYRLNNNRRIGLTSLGHSYGDESPGQLGTEHGTTFWSAAAQIVQQVFELLKPNGVAVWVVKNYVRDGAIVPFSQQWQTLCHHVGFVTLHEHHALLVEDHGTQHDLLQPDTPDRKPTSTAEDMLKPLVSTSTYAVHNQATRVSTKRASFFRKLHEKRRPDLAIDFEVVLCMQKPLDTAPGSLDLCCSSPPYAGAGEVLGAHHGIDYSKVKGSGQRLTPGRAMQPYGHTEGQLGAMPPGSLDLCLSSPPYVHSVHDGNGIDQTKLTGNRPGRHTQTKAEGYGPTPGNLGNLPEGQQP